GRADAEVEVPRGVDRRRSVGERLPMTPQPRIAAIILAAGRSTRMGPSNKLLADVCGRPLLRHVAEAAIASRARPVLVVVGHQAAAFRGALAALGATFVDNPAHAAALTTSPP